jgi:hypothetical protein
MFSEVLSEAERAELLTWIEAWEAAHPDVDAAHRVTGWIDVAYDFQSRRNFVPTSARTDRPARLTLAPSH